MLVTLPCLLLLLDFWPLQRFRPSAAGGLALLAEKLPFLLLALASCWITYRVQQSGGAVSMAYAPGLRLANFLVALARYLGLFFWPAGLAVMYPHSGHMPSGQARQRPWILVGWCWLVGLLVPVSGVLVQVGMQALADRYTYLPVLGLELALLWTLDLWATGTGRRAVLAGGAGLALAGCIWATWREQAVWHDSRTLFEQAVRHTRNNYLALGNLGIAYWMDGRTDDGAECFRQALAIQPDYAPALVGYGNYCSIKRRFAEAANCYRKAITTGIREPQPFLNLAMMLLALDRVEEAVEPCRRAIALEPLYPEAHAHLGYALYRLGRNEEALHELQVALRQRPDYARARIWLDAVRQADHGVATQRERAGGEGARGGDE